jgi:chromosome segregation ATPase
MKRDLAVVTVNDLAEQDRRIGELERELADAKASIVAKVDTIDELLRRLKKKLDADKLADQLAHKEAEIARLQLVVRNQQGRIDRELDRTVQQQQRTAGLVSELELRVDELEGENDRLRAVATSLAVLGGLVS